MRLYSIQFYSYDSLLLRKTVNKFGKVLKLYKRKKILLYYRNKILKKEKNLIKFKLKLIGPVFLPLKIKKFCILRSPFKHKDSREQLEIRLSKVIYYIDKSYKDLKHFLTMLNIPSGIKVRFLLIK